jgi:hypothetical protein
VGGCRRSTVGARIYAGGAARCGERLEASEPSVAELLIDLEEDRTLRAVLVGMLREADG